MPWSGTPKTFVAGAVLPASDLNTELRDRMLTLRAGGIALTGQQPFDFLYALDDDQFARLAAVASMYPRFNAAGTAWEMAIPTAGVHELTLPFSFFRPTPTNGCGWPEDASATNDIGGMPFSGTSTQACYCWLPLPRSWNKGTFTAQFYTFNKAGGSGNFVFSLAALAVSDDEPISGALGTAQQVTDTILAANDVQISAETAAITPGGSPANNDLTLFVVKRLPLDAADDYGSVNYFHAVKLRLLTNAENDA